MPRLNLSGPKGLREGLSMDRQKQRVGLDNGEVHISGKPKSIFKGRSLLNIEMQADEALKEQINGINLLQKKGKWKKIARAKGMVSSSEVVKLLRKRSLIDEKEEGQGEDSYKKQRGDNVVEDFVDHDQVAAATKQPHQEP
ncbi:hypothetical protein CIPAW_08G087800 [Carya illinoinensis]|uniref:Uncharacterized protein n=1 Tax=Carya illinoinensis TaxID=32201 RepID=A0A8T1PT24_CARIL|nr:hypothetical protein CIPAW_08G087800 [Carya illinoinensis]